MNLNNSQRAGGPGLKPTVVNTTPPINPFQAGNAELPNQVQNILIQHVNHPGHQKTPSAGSDQPSLTPPTTGDPESMLLALMEISTALQDQQLEINQGVLTGEMDKIQTLGQERLDALEEAQRKAAEAKKNRKRSGLFGWIGTIAAVAVAAVATVVTGGAAAPMLALTVFNAGMMLAQETGLMDKLLDAVSNGNPDLKLALSIGIAVAMVAANVAVAMSTGGAGMATAIGLAEGIPMIVQGGFQVAATVQEKQAAVAGIQANDATARMATVQAAIEMLSEAVKELVTQMSESHQAVVGMLQASFQAKQAVVALQV